MWHFAQCCKAQRFPARASGNDRGTYCTGNGAAGDTCGAGTSPYALRLPGTFNWDMELSKYINFTERWKLQLRAEYFNIVNHPNFAPESTSTGNGQRN